MFYMVFLSPFFSAKTLGSVANLHEVVAARDLNNPTNYQNVPAVGGFGVDAWGIFPGRMDTWLGRAPIYKPWSSAIWKGSHNPIRRGQKRSPWL